MNRYDALERELSAWLIETPLPRTPGFRDDVLQRTAQLRQRPRWSFLERWLPVTVVRFRRRRAFPPVPWRTIGLLAVLAMLLAAVAVYVGSKPRLPPPFGLAGSGLVAYSQNGDVFTVDPRTGVRQMITSGLEQDSEPRWSLDGTRIAFLRGSDLSQRVVVVDAKTGTVISATGIQGGIVMDAMSWSPDGRTISIDQSGEALKIVDAASGSMTQLAVAYASLDVYWRPPDGRQLLVFGGSNPEAADPALYVVDIDDPSDLRVVARVPQAGGLLRPSGWADDGRRVVYSAGHADIEKLRTHVQDLATGEEVIIEAAFAHVSNDSKRIVALDDTGRPCVASIDGGPCVSIGEAREAYEPTSAAGAFWSPDDRWIISRLGRGDTVLLDPEGRLDAQPSWISDGAMSWQRVAR
jgi:dipeptidyl aminopeptidase/acylaminoacyl peptidase